MSKKIKDIEERGVQMYCGPDIPGAAWRGMLFTDCPPLLAEHIGVCPAIGNFVVAPQEYANLKRKAADPGSFLSVQRQRVLRYLEGVKV